jgi:hypothetical protein
MYYGGSRYSWMLADLFPSLCCFYLYQPRHEGIKREKKKKRKQQQIGWGLSDPAASCSQLVNRQVGQQQLPDSAQSSYVL